MKALKLAIAAIGILGLLSVFVLPYVKLGGEESLTFWKTAQLGDGKIQGYMALAGFALATLMGLMAAKGGLARWHAILAFIGFIVCLVPDGVRAGFKDGAIGGKLLLISAVVGAVVSLVAVVKPERA